ncbi:MAG: hypothetical protein HYS17_10915 [Micavibrio aeruginosavorus]|uniref:DUF922 domain-containing protein n=1 Tax=Micavibrio aeruginosavorus TaxID=349221 RepID=A0A7T5UH34_9BACT|nr:MAG: hypothetical protein HYS17_10915 [Micavibrio aeruginosavorus]
MLLRRVRFAAIGAFAALGPLVFPLPVLAAEACAPGEAPAIEIVVSEDEPRFDYKFSREELGRFPGNNGIPMLAIYDITVNALSAGRMRVRHSLSFRRTMSPDKQVCVYISGIEVAIHIEPVIYMAKELKTLPCEYKQYLEHEMKHIEADRRLVEDYRDIIRRNAGFAFPQPADFAVGPVPASLRKEAEEELTYNVTGVLRSTIDSMMRERSFRQREIDSVGEYNSLTLACATQEGVSDPAASEEEPAFDINKPF